MVLQNPQMPGGKVTITPVSETLQGLIAQQVRTLECLTTTLQARLYQRLAADTGAPVPQERTMHLRTEGTMTRVALDCGFVKELFS